MSDTSNSSFYPSTCRGMADKEAEVLPTGVAKGLAEKFYEKRKNAALEIEKFALVYQYNRYTIFKR